MELNLRARDRRLQTSTQCARRNPSCDTSVRRAEDGEGLATGWTAVGGEEEGRRGPGARGCKRTYGRFEREGIHEEARILVDRFARPWLPSR